MTCKDRLIEYLKKNGVQIQEERNIQKLPHKAYTAREIAEYETDVSFSQVAKVVIIQVSDSMVMLVLPASKRVDFRKLQVHWKTDKLSLAREVDFAGIFPDCELGTMPPFGNLYNLKIYVDRNLANEETIFFRIGTYTEIMSLKYSDFKRLTRPKVLDFAALA